jgi:Putative phage serine protease XkdF
MASKNILPLYEMVIDENPDSDVEVSFIALVDKPAIEKTFMAFRQARMRFATDTTRKIISGPAMIPDTPIYRNDAQGEYNVVFSKKTISDIVLKFFKKDYQKNLKMLHSSTEALEGVTIFESFISDKDRGIKPMIGFQDLPDGTWFVSAKIENPDAWTRIQSGEIKGFSVEGLFSYLKKQGLTVHPDGRAVKFMKESRASKQKQREKLVIMLKKRA